MKEQRERLVSNAVDANLGIVEGTQSRFIDMGFVAPVVDAPEDYAGNFINAIKAGTQAIESSDNYKINKAAESSSGEIEAENQWGNDWKEINEAVDPETNSLYTPQQKQIAAVQKWELIKQSLKESGKSAEYADSFYKKYSSSVTLATRTLFTQETANVRINNESDWAEKFTKNTVSQDEYRAAMANNGMDVVTQSKNMLKFKTDAIKDASVGYYAKQDAFAEHITELQYTKKASGVYSEDNKEVKQLMEEGLTYEQARDSAIKKDVFEESKEINPSLILLKSIVDLNALSMKGEPNNKLMTTLKTAEVTAARKAIASAVTVQRQFKDIDSFDVTKNSLTNMEDRLTAGAIDGNALSASAKARTESKVTSVMDRDMADILDSASSNPESIKRFNNMLALNSDNKTITDRYKQGFSLTMGKLISSKEIDVLSTLNYIESRVGTDRATNSAVWGLMNSMPRWQTAILAKEMGASANDLEMLVASFDEQDYDDNGVIRLQGASKKQSAAIFEEAREVIDEMPIMQGDYKRYLNLTATMMLIADRTGHVDMELIKEKMLSASTYNVGTPLTDFGMKEGFRIPNTYKKSIALNAKSPTMVATATLMAVESNNLATLKAQGFPIKTTFYYDDEGTVLERERVDWGQVDTRWVQVAPGRFDFRIQSGDTMKDFQISDDLIVNTIGEAQKRATVAARKEERSRTHVLNSVVSEAGKQRKIEYDLKMRAITAKRAKKQAEAEAKGERGPEDKYGIVTEAIIKWLNED